MFLVILEMNSLYWAKLMVAHVCVHTHTQTHTALRIGCVCRQFLMLCVQQTDRCDSKMQTSAVHPKSNSLGSGVMWVCHGGTSTLSVWVRQPVVCPSCSTAGYSCKWVTASQAEQQTWHIRKQIREYFAAELCLHSEEIIGEFRGVSW